MIFLSASFSLTIARHSAFHDTRHSKKDGNEIGAGHDDVDGHEDEIVVHCNCFSAIGGKVRW